MAVEEQGALLWDAPQDMSERSCMLVVTHACNLNCTYCYEAHKDGRQMTFQVAKAILEREIETVRTSPVYRYLMVEFMGGEPLSNFELIREVVEWLKGLDLEFPWHSYATTNATLLTEEKERWFAANSRHITLGASLDGDESMQDANRGTGPVRGIEFIHKTWPWQNFHMTVSRQTLPNLAHGVEHLVLGKGFGIEIALAQGQEWTDADADVYREQLAAIGRMYLAHPELKAPNILNRPLGAIAALKAGDTQRRFCGSGKYMTAYDVDGQAYACHMFSPVVLGEKALKKDELDWDDASRLADNACKDCFLRNFCPTCIGFNYRYRGSIGKRDMHNCRMILAQALACCEFQIAYLARHFRRLSPGDAQNAKAALQVLDALRSTFDNRNTSPYVQPRHRGGRDRMPGMPRGRGERR